MSPWHRGQEPPPPSMAPSRPLRAVPVPSIHARHQGRSRHDDWTFERRLLHWGVADLEASDLAVTKLWRSWFSGHR